MHLLLLARECERHVGRQQVILAPDLEAMAREEKEGGVARAKRSLECGQAVAHAAAVLIGRGDHLEAKPLEGLCHSVGIVRRLPQRRDMLITVVADHQRDPLLGQGGRYGRRQRKPERQADGGKENDPFRHRSSPTERRHCSSGRAGQPLSHEPRAGFNFRTDQPEP